MSRALVAVVALIAIACAPTHATGPNVLLVGDSILNGSRSQVTDALQAAGWQPSIEAVGGTAISFWVGRLQLYVDSAQPDIVVIELGTNDCSPVQCVPLDPYIDQIMQAIPSSVPVVWLNSQTDVPAPFNEGRDFVNGAIEAASVRWPNLDVIDFAGFFAGHPEWHNPDGLHPNPEGRKELASFLADELEPYKPQ